MTRWPLPGHARCALLIGAFAVACPAMASTGNAGAQAGSSPAAAASSEAIAAAGRPASPSASVTVSAWESDDTPIAYARLRLRSVVTGRIHAAAVANELGEAAFHGVEPGSYIVELVSEAGKVLTVGQRFTASAGETVATFVRLGARVPWFSGFFGNAAAVIAATAAATGITALAPEEIRPVSARR